MKKTLLILPALLLSGCATIMSGTTQTIHLKVVGADHQKIISNVSCIVKDAKGNTYTVDQNPGSILVTKGMGALHTTCVAKGYKQKRVGYGQSFNAWTVANVLFWPGLIVDAASGAIQKYPSYITVEMTRVRKAKNHR